MILNDIMSDEALQIEEAINRIEVAIARTVKAIKDTDKQKDHLEETLGDLYKEKLRLHLISLTYD
jgi:hypothetical protein